mmetsp:Transcript_46824/g.99410  ORF Transcript_46824/g.99410 Transcript_46824/m.99410 type:complete len:229 (+) Transcript_46824:1359-2045(+)
MINIIVGLSHQLGVAIRTTVVHGNPTHLKAAIHFYHVELAWCCGMTDGELGAWSRRPIDNCLRARWRTRNRHLIGHVSIIGNRQLSSIIGIMFRAWRSVMGKMLLAWRNMHGVDIGVLRNHHRFRSDLNIITPSTHHLPIFRQHHQYLVATMTGRICNPPTTHGEKHDLSVIFGYAGRSGLSTILNFATVGRGSKKIVMFRIKRISKTSRLEAILLIADVTRHNRVYP